MAGRNSPVSYEAFPAAPATTARTYFGRRRSFAGLHLLEWLFLLISIVNILGTMGMSIYSLVRIIKADSTSPDVTLTILLLVNGVFCLFYVINGLFREKEFEIYALVAAILFVLIYCILEYGTNADDRTTLKLTRLIAACILAPANVVLAILVAREFGWLEFNVVGASEALQRMYREAALFASLLTFDLQVIVSFVILVLKNGLSVDTIYEKVALGVGLPLSFLLCGLGYFSMLRESHWGMALYVCLGLLAPGYVFYVMYRVNNIIYHGMEDTPTKMLVYGTIAAGVAVLVVRIAIYISSWRVFKNFNMGLRQRAFNDEVDETSNLLSASNRR